MTSYRVGIIINNNFIRKKKWNIVFFFWYRIFNQYFRCLENRFVRFVRLSWKYRIILSNSLVAGVFCNFPEGSYVIFDRKTNGNVHFRTFELGQFKVAIFKWACYVTMRCIDTLVSGNTVSKWLEIYKHFGHWKTGLVNVNIHRRSSAMHVRLYTVFGFADFAEYELCHEFVYAQASSELKINPFSIHLSSIRASYLYGLQFVYVHYTRFNLV